MLGWRRKGRTEVPEPALPRPAVRVLRDAAELASASERAAEGERRLRARLEARAARDAWTAEHRPAARVDVVPGMRLAAGAPPPRSRAAQSPLLLPSPATTETATTETVPGEAVTSPHPPAA